MKKWFALLLLLCLTASAALAEAPSSAATLVVYFSATGNTRPLAEYAAARATPSAGSYTKPRNCFRGLWTCPTAAARRI